jgi:WD40 repeat protein
VPSVFLSYSRQDEAWKDHLKKHLGVLEAQGLLDTWDDRRIEAGADWFEEIQDAMAQASVAVLLISADYLTSKFILGKEVPKLLERRSREGLPVIPVIVHACAWEQVKWLRPLQARPKDDRALAGFQKERRNQELKQIAQEILAILDRKLEAWDTARDREFRSPTDDFLDRVAAVCRLREPEAEIRRFPGIGDAGGYLRIVRRDGDIQDAYPVGAIEHGLTRELFQAFLSEIDAPYRKNDPGMIARLVYGGDPAPPDLVAEASQKRVRLVSFVEHQGLIDFRNYLKKQTDKLSADPIYPPRLYVPQRMQTLSIGSLEQQETEDALKQVREWLGSPHGRFLVLLGDFGTGKTFLLHELARRMGEAEGGLVPILLQMRSLEKGRSLDALLAQHFAQEGMDGFSPAKFRYMLEQGRIALLFDGFDELALRVTYSKAADHFATLLQAANGSAKVVLTSRRQHFISETQVKTALAEQVEFLSGHRLAILQPFRREQVRQFLINFFDGDETKAEARLDLIDRVQDLLGLSSNPRLLGFITELPEEKLVAACAEGDEITAAKLYELLLERWLVYEFDRVHPKGAPPGLSVAERWQAVTLLAMRLWQKTDRFVSLSDLSDEAARVVQAVGPAALDAETATFQIGSGTLLVRDEEGNFAFLHQSILEWLVARSAAEALAAGADPAALAVREISPLMVDFLVNLAGRDAAVVWARGILRDSENETIKKNALLVLERQKEAIGGRLAGQDLRGKDFSGQDLSGADLSGADLTGARLPGTRLTAARLVRSTLREADLSRAVLAGADLSDADLTGARLMGADLRGAWLARARFRRARLAGAVLETESFETADVFGAALDLLEFGPQGGAMGSSSAVSWSPDGELLASAAGCEVRLWEIQSGREIRAFTGHQDWINSVAFSPDGKSIASGSSDNTVRLWQIDTGREIQTFTGHQHKVTSVAINPDGKSIVSGSDDNTVRLWQVDTGREVRVFTGNQHRITSLAFSPNGKSIASGFSDNTVRLWQVETGGEIQAFTGHLGMVLSVSFSPDGKSIVSGSEDETVHLWQVDTGREIQAFTGHLGPISSVAFSPDGKSIASGSWDNTIRLWQVDTGREVRTFTAHQNSVYSVAFSPNGKSIASSSSDNTVRLWQVDTGREVRTFTAHHHSVYSVAFSPDGKSIASGSSDSTVRLWQTCSGRENRAFIGHRDLVLSVAFSPDGKSIASGSYDNTVRLWQAGTGREVRALTGHQKSVYSIAFSPDGKSIASGSYDNTVRLWQVDNGREVQALSGHQRSVTSVAFSPDGKSIASGSEDNTIRFWQIDTGREIRAFAGHQYRVTSVAFSPDGKSIASGSDDNSVRLWQVDNGKELSVFTGHQYRVTSVAFSPDGKSIASGAHDHTARLWQVDSGREIRALSGHHYGVRSVAFSPDAKSLASGSEDGTIRLWNVADGRCLAVLLSLPEGWVAYSPDGRYKFGGVPAGGFWHVANLCRFEIGELDEWVPGLRLADDASFFDLPPWKPEVRVPERVGR